MITSIPNRSQARSKWLLGVMPFNCSSIVGS